VRLYRIGDKVVSAERVHEEITRILKDREAGATQEEVARQHGVQRSFVSFLETLGEIRRGARIGVVGFPIANGDEVREVAERYAVDLVLVLSQSERESIEASSNANIFNMLLDTLADLRDFDVVVLLASDWRISTLEKILGAEVVGITLGPSPLRSDVTVDTTELAGVLESIMSTPAKHRGRVGTALREAADLAGRWVPSRKS
jgi:hypothetical protein